MSDEYGGDSAKTRQSTVASAPGPAPLPGMVWIPGGTYRMGSDNHYVEERPVHRVSVDGFWIDPQPVTNAESARFVEETGQVTFAEISPDPKAIRVRSPRCCTPARSSS